MDQQICFTAPQAVIGIIGSVVVGASTLANFIKSPDEYTSPVMQWISRLIHFVAFDIVTAVKK